jgi:hypothetical protein
MQIQAEIIDDKTGIPAGWFMEVCGISKDYYDQLVYRKHLTVLRPGGGKGRPAIIRWSNLPDRFRSIILQHGDPEAAFKRNMLTPYLHEDYEAKKYYADYPLPDGRPLPPEVQREYSDSATVLNAVGEAFSRTVAFVRARNGKVKKEDIWQTLAGCVGELDRKEYRHNLPLHPRNLEKKYMKYRSEGYRSLVHPGFCNQAARRVNGKLEHLLLSMYCMGNKPYGSWVLDYYLQFLSGNIELADTRTGEYFDRSEFVDKSGAPLTVSETTVRNYINNPANRALVESLRMSYHRFGSDVRPHFQRNNARLGLSKISLDDRDLPRRLHNGKRVKAYYAYDVASGALIGAAYSESKNADLFIECLRDTFRFIDRHGWGMPAEAEVENHLVRQFEEDLMRAGTLFSFVRWCAPTNSQEKHAEQLNRQKKYGYEKRYQDGIGRWYAKDKSNMTEGERVYDEATDKYVIREKTYSYEQLVADDKFTIEAYNNGLHRDQKRYPGKTRLQVLSENLNPNLVAYDRPLLAWYIGEKTPTTIRRNMYCRVRHADYMLPSSDVLRRLAPGNYNVDAHYLPAADGSVGDVYLYQNGVYLCAADVVEKFTTAQAEWTEEDTAAMTRQAKYISHFDKSIKEGKQKIARGIKVFEIGPEADLVIPEEVRVQEYNDAGESLDDLIEKFSAGVREKAFEMA